MKLTILCLAIAGSVVAPTLPAADVPAAKVPAAWKEHCANCHGLDGKADTRLGRKLKIRSLTDPAVQAEFKDEHIPMAIHDGVVDHRGRDRMQPVTGLSAAEIKELVVYIRSLKREEPKRRDAR